MTTCWKKITLRNKSKVLLHCQHNKNGSVLRYNRILPFDDSQGFELPYLLLIHLNLAMPSNSENGLTRWTVTLPSTQALETVIILKTVWVVQSESPIKSWYVSTSAAAPVTHWDTFPPRQSDLRHYSTSTKWSETLFHLKRVIIDIILPRESDAIFLPFPRNADCSANPSLSSWGATLVVHPSRFWPTAFKKCVQSKHTRHGLRWLGPEDGHWEPVHSFLLFLPRALGPPVQLWWSPNCFEAFWKFAPHQCNRGEEKMQQKKVHLNILQIHISNCSVLHIWTKMFHRPENKVFH